MPDYQYRVAGELGWQSNSGNALLVISNPADSGKKLVIKGFEITNQSSSTSVPTSAAPTILQLARATVAGGILLQPVRSDTNAPAWPATVALTRRSTVASPLPLRQLAVAKQLNQASLSWFGRQSPITRFAGLYSRPKKDSAVEGVVVRAGEGLALYVADLQNSIPLRVSVSLVRKGAPDRLYHLRYFTNCLAANEAIFGINNAVGSGETIVLRNIAVEEVGTFDSPYFQIVPVGSVVEAGNADVPQMTKMDSAAPDATAFIKLQQDVSILPFGMPENALADSSLGSPKGFNYLKTKDFLGPVLRTIFPEGLAARTGAMPDVPARGHRMADIGFIGGGITIREGEGIALVSGAETAAGATAAVGVSGWSSFEFGVTISVQPKIVPLITLSANVSLLGAEVRIYDLDNAPAGSLGTELSGTENNAGATFAFTAEIGNVIWVQIMAPGFAEFGQQITVPDADTTLNILLTADINA